MAEFSVLFKSPFETSHPPVDPRRFGLPAGHYDAEILIDGDVDLAAGHIDGDGGTQHPRFSGHGRGRTAAVRNQGVARPIPDLDPDIVTIQDLKNCTLVRLGNRGLPFFPLTVSFPFLILFPAKKEKEANPH